MQGPRKNHSRRLDRIEDALPPVFVEIEALRILVGLMLDVDFGRTVETDVEPMIFELLERLEDRLEEIDPGTEDVTEQIRVAALAAAIGIADRGETVDIEVDDGQEPANDD